MKAIIYIIAGFLVLLPVIASVFVSWQIKRDRKRLRAEVFFRRTSGVPRDQWSHELIGYEEEVERKLQELYPNCKL